MARPQEIPDDVWSKLQSLYQMHKAAGRVPAEFGERYELVSVNDPYTRLRPGDRGTLIREYTDAYNVPYSILWDSGSNLSVFPREVRSLGQRIAPEDLEGQ